MRKLVLKILEFNTLVAKMTTQNLLIFDKALSEQFNKLIYQLLYQMDLTISGSLVFIVIIDILNEYKKEQYVKAIIDL